MGDDLELGHLERPVDRCLDFGVARGPQPPDGPRADAPATVNPGSSSLMPVMSPSTVAAIGPTVSRLGASGQTPAVGTRP